MTKITAEWQDTTCYSRSERDRVPRVWSRGKWPYEIRVHRRHGIDDRWFVTCHVLCVDGRALTSHDIEPAKGEACDTVRVAIRDLVDGMRAALGDDVNVVNDGLRS